MLPKAENACFLIADISGYTSYLAGVELDHAQDIIADLISTVVKCLRPPFKLAKFEGDAAFLYANGDRFDGALIQDSVDSAYFNFRKRLRNIEQATSCACKACHGMGQLDLKFVCHHGEFVKQRIAGRDELAGRDVIVVHRLLKNTVADRLSGHAYALFTDAAIEAAGIDPAAQGIAAHEEIVDIIGRVGCRVLDLSTAWREETERSRYLVTRRKAAHVIEFDISAPRPQVWEYVTTPGRRTQWRAADEVREFASGGRRGVGTTNHCMHGPHAIIEEILDWRPYDYLTLTTLLPMPNAPKILMTYTFAERADGGTRIEFRIAKPKPKDAAFLEHAVEEFRKHISAEIATLGTLIGRAEAGNAAGEDRDISVPERRVPAPRTSKGDDGLSER